MSDDYDARDSKGTFDTGRLLLTKLRPPRAASDGIQRGRLLREIERGVDGKLTLIVTPPGFGKSTLVSQWQSQSSRASAWLSLDVADNDFLIFLEYLVAAIRTIDPEICPSTFEHIHSGFQLAGHQLMDMFINEIFVATRPFVVVLDDYHVITSEVVHDSLLYLLNAMPASMSLIVTSRAIPPIPTMRMGARGELVELGTDDLSFDLNETKEFLNVQHQLDLAQEEIEVIDRWAEGWPVALRLAASSLRNRPRERFKPLLDALTDNVPSVAEYLWDEAIQSQSPDRRTFLMKTAILRQFNPSLAEHVTGNPASSELIESLSRENFFISRLSGPGNWYRYHYIFSEVLHDRLKLEMDTEAARALHERAALWYEENELIPEAAHHAIRAQSWPMATRLLVQICSEFYNQERVGTLHLWLDSLPDGALRIEPILAYWLAWAKVRTGQARDAVQAISIAEAATGEADTPEVMKIALQLRILKSLFAWDVEAGYAAASALLALLGPGDSPDRARALIMLGMLQETGGMLKASEQSLEIARGLNSGLGIRGLHVAELSAAGNLQLAMGKLREPADLFRRIIKIGDEWNDLPLQSAHHKLGGILYEWNQLSEAGSYGERAAELARRMNAPFHLAQVHALFARIAAVEENWDAAIANIELAIAESQSAGYLGIIPLFEALRARIWLMSGQFTLAKGWLQRIGPDIVQSTRYQEISLALTALRIQIEDGRSARTIAPLDALRRQAAEQHHYRRLLTIQVVRAIAENELGDREAALAALDEALMLGEREGFIRSFLDEGPRIVPVLLQKASDFGSCKEYANAILTVVGAAPGTIGNHDSGILSPRERDVMRLVASGLSNRDIGEALFISEETVKTHLRRIFEKLEVTSRTQAIHKSQQLELL